MQPLQITSMENNMLVDCYVCGTTMVFVSWNLIFFSLHTLKKHIFSKFIFHKKIDILVYTLSAEQGTGSSAGFF